MSDFTFLTEEQIFGSDKLDILRKRGTKAAITDFAILLGGYYAAWNYIYNDSSLSGRTGCYWTKSDYADRSAYAINGEGCKTIYLIIGRDGGGRPALPFSSIYSIPMNGGNWKRAKDGVLEVEYGYYPQKAVSTDMQEILEYAYINGYITKTTNTYTTDSVKNDGYDTRFMANRHDEYDYDGKRYVRVKTNNSLNGDNVTLSNGEKYQNGDYAWVEVEPVKWLVDEKSKIMLTEKLIFAGIQFNEERNYKTADFDKTNIKRFMDTYLSKELVQNRSLSQDSISQNTTETENIAEGKKPARKKNPYEFKFEGVSEEDIVKGAVQSGVAVFLHGRSSEGKSARVKQIDPDCEIIYLRNATPESLNGKSVYNQVTGEMIDVKPTWLQKLENKCEQEPDKLHIVFLDEITNALPSIQGMAFNIVLDREVNGKWKLPENARIVAAGNDLSDSLAANELAEPLFNRFAHVYIETTVESWLKWAASPKESYERLDYEKQEPEAKIHPSIYAYIAYKAFSKQDVLRTPYDGKKPNADPRKWEMASKVLYATKQPEMLRSLIGEDLTRDFTEFCKQQVISVEDVIQGNYTSSDLEMNVSEKYATAVGLSAVDEKNLITVRNFVSKLGAEILSTFENLWVHGDNKRLEKIAEIKLMELAEGEIEL